MDNINIRNGIRLLKTGGEKYNYLFNNNLAGNTIHLSKDIDAEATVGFMHEIVHSTLQDTALLGAKLRGSNISETCQNVWQFVMDNIQYKPDNAGDEQLRRPLRLWKERLTGGDCDCMTIFVNSCLLNAGIPAKNIKTRIASYNGTEDWQHVYTIVTDEKGKAICVDAVIHTFNLEKEFHYKKDFPMSTTYLNGLGDATDELRKQLEISLFLAKQSPKAISDASGYEEKEFIYKLENLLQNWGNETERDRILAQLAAEDDAHESEMKGLYGELYAVKSKTKTKSQGKSSSKKTQSIPKKKKFFAQIKTAVTQVKTAVKTKDKAKIKEIVRKVIHATTRINPLWAAGRGGVQLFFKGNFFGLSKVIGLGYKSQSEAVAAGISASQHGKLVNYLKEIEKIYFTIGGKPENLQESIQKGATKGKTLKGELGVVGLALAAGSAATAVPTIIAMLNAASKVGLHTEKGKLHGLGEMEEEDMNIFGKLLALGPKLIQAIGALFKKKEPGENDAITETENVEESGSTPPEMREGIADETTAKSNTMYYVLGGLVLVGIGGYWYYEKYQKGLGDISENIELKSLELQ